jgi:hypothetical protein
MEQVGKRGVDMVSEITITVTCQRCGKSGTASIDIAEAFEVLDDPIYGGTLVDGFLVFDGYVYCRECSNDDEFLDYVNGRRVEAIVDNEDCA